MQDITHPDDLPGNLDMFQTMIETGTSFEIEKRYVRKDGNIVCVSNSVSPIRSESGDIVQAVTATTDVTERRKAQDEARRLATIIASSDDAIISTDLEMNIQSWNRGAERLYGYTAAEAVGRPATIVVPSDIVDEERVIIDRIKTGEHVQPHETRRVHKDGTEIPVSLRVSPVHDEHGRVVGASNIARDIRERKEAERLQNLLVGELTHRVKNLLATVNAIVRQTLGPAAPDSSAAVLEARLQSLAKANDLLTVSNWNSASLNDIVQEAIAPYPPGRFELTGEDVHVGSRAVVPLSLVLHELGTNAAKYGALSVEGGSVLIAWAFTGADGSVLKLRWEERNGPPVNTPSRRGFGSRLIQAVATSELGGRVAVDFAASGLVCNLEIARTALANR